MTKINIMKQTTIPSALLAAVFVAAAATMPGPSITITIDCFLFL
jgi:hypothetical protein